MSHTYWRLTFTHSSYTKLAEIEMRATAGGADQCSGGTPSASTTYSSNTADKAFDNNTGTYWESGASSGPHWVQYQFASPVDVQEVMVRAGNANTEHYSQIKLSYSDDGSTWTDVQSWAAARWVSGREERYLVGGTKTYWRIQVSEVDSDTVFPMYCEFAELVMRVSPGGATQCTGNTPISDSVASGSYAVENAFDGNAATDWSSANSNDPWIGYHFAEDKEIVEYAITASAIYEEYSPQAWKLQYSGDGLTWTDADTRSGETGWTGGETRTFSVSAPPSTGARRRPVYVVTS